MNENIPNIIGIIQVIIFCVEAAVDASPSTDESCICVFCVLFIIIVEPAIERIERATRMNQPLPFLKPFSLYLPRL